MRIRVYERYMRANMGKYYHADSSLGLTVLEIIIAQQTASFVLATMTP